MEYRILKAEEKIEAGDEKLQSTGEWTKVICIGDFVGNKYVGEYRRPIAAAFCDPAFSGKDCSVFSTNSVTITIKDPACIKQAAAFLGAIAMMLDGQSDS